LKISRLSFKKRPGIRNDDENVILLEMWWMKHHIVVKKTDNSACAADRYASLELCGRPVSHVLAAHHPRVYVDGEDHEDLELAGTSERRLGWIAWIDEG